MNKYLLLACLFYVTVFSAQELITEIPILNNEKHITNLSGKINDSTSFHLIIVKNKDFKKFETKPVFISGLEIIQLKNIITEEKPLSSSESKNIKLTNIITETEPSFLTFHVNNEVLTITKALERGYMLYDLDYKNKTIKSNMLKVFANRIFSHSDLTIFVKVVNGRFEVHKVLDSDTKISNSYTIKNEDDLDLFEDIESGKTEFINDKVYIEKGSIEPIRGFYYNKTLSFIKDDKKSGEVKLIQLFEDDTYEIQSINLEFDKARKQNSFLKDNLLFSFSMEVNVAKFIVYDIENKSILKELEYNTEDFGEYNKVVINGEERTNNFKSRGFLRSFYPQAVGSMYNPELYIGVNKSINDDYIIEIGHVDKNTFKNKSFGNYWWTNNAFGSQFGGIADQYNYKLGGWTASVSGLQMSFWNALAEHRRKGNYFNLVLDKELNVKKDEAESVYYFLDDDTYDSRLENFYKLKNHFYIIMKKSVRVINYDKAENKYEIFELTKI